jgi:amino acid adenylation domain-containing protein
MSASRALDWNEGWLDGSIAERFRAVAERYPKKEAVVDGQQRLAYAELDTWSSQIQQGVLQQRGDRSEPVLILAGQTCLAVAALLGALKAGKFYSIVDPQQSTDWLATITADLQPALVLHEDTATNQGRQLASIVHAPAFSLESLIQEELPAARGTTRRILPTDLAVVLFTSGTTGKPKGIMISQRSILQRGLVAVQRSEVHDTARLLSILSPAFGLGVTSLFGPVLNGATLVWGRSDQLGAVDLLRLIQDEAITAWKAPPSMLRSLLPGFEAANKSLGLQHFSTGGERLYRDDAVRWLKLLPPNAIFEYRLGSTEALGAYAKLRLDGGLEIDGLEVPAGYPPPEVEVQVVNDALQPVPQGETGEIVVRMDFMAEGYWKQPELTAERFLPDPDGGNRRILLTGDLGYFRPDGCLVFMGRKDAMLKVRGFRVEPEAIERALRGLPEVQTAAVGAQQLAAGDLRLIAYVVPEANSRPSATSLRQQLARSLPDYFVPSQFLFLDALPLNPSGKIDRAALPQPPQSRPALGVPYTAPRTPFEEHLAAIWTDVMEIDEIGVHDPFLDLGGDSLQAARIASRVAHEFQIELPTRVLFEAPTVADMALLITLQQASQLDQATLESLLAQLEA